MKQMKMKNNTVLDSSNNLETKIADLILKKNTDTNSKKVFVLLESSYDKKLYQSFFNENAVFTYPTGSCKFVISMLKKLNNEDIFKNHLIGIKDADFDFLLSKQYNLSNLFLTDYHDWEIMILKCKEVGYKILIEIFNDYSNDYISMVMNDLKIYSYLKYYNIEQWNKNKDGISFDGIRICKLYEDQILNNVPAILKYVGSKNKPEKEDLIPTPEKLEKFISNHKDIDVYQLSNGHDILKGLLAKAQYEKKQKISLNEKEVGCMLRSAYTIECFKTTELYKSIDIWAKDKNYYLWKN